MNDALILGIETSCDETAVAVVKNGKIIVDSIISSQIKMHSEYGGVVPEIAARMHLEIIMQMIDTLLRKNNLRLKEDIDAIAVTSEPGLIGALLVGVSVAKSLAYALNKPLIPVNHILGHLFAPNLEFEIEYPVIGLIISGGHTLLVKSDFYNSYTILGGTVDDAVGESFDKVAKMLELGYPGGPIVEKCAASGNPEKINFPRPMLKENNYNFSFSGLKTAVNYFLKNNAEFKKEDVCASFQKAAFDILINKTLRAAEEYKINNIVVGGGVAANKTLKKMFDDENKQIGKNIYFPSLKFCTDNAAMIAGIAYYFIKSNTDVFDLALNPAARIIARHG